HDRNARFRFISPVKNVSERICPTFAKAESHPTIVHSIRRMQFNSKHRVFRAGKLSPPRPRLVHPITPRTDRHRVWRWSDPTEALRLGADRKSPWQGSELV